MPAFVGINQRKSRNIWVIRLQSLIRPVFETGTSRIQTNSLPTFQYVQSNETSGHEVDRLEGMEQEFYKSTKGRKKTGMTDSY